MRKKRLLPLLLAMAIMVVSLPLTALADTSKVVTLGADLTAEQKEAMYEYFGANRNEVTTIEVTNADERVYMEGIASEEQIGHRTLSCSYVEPTESGGIQVKVANLTYVTSSMIASTLLTSGVKNCNVVAACPIAVSGTGALTGIMMAYESATGKELDENMKEVATEELITTGQIAEAIGSEQAEEIMAEVKNEILSGNIEDKEQIREVIEKVSDEAGIGLTEEQIDAIMALMEKIVKFDYDKEALKNTLKNIQGISGDSEGFVSNIISTIQGFFGGESKEDGGIINDTNDALLGAEAVVDSTVDKVKEVINSKTSDNGSEDSDSADGSEKTGEAADQAKGILRKIIVFCRSLFSNENN